VTAADARQFKLQCSPRRQAARPTYCTLRSPGNATTKTSSFPAPAENHAS
jgi:hypothetical protein